MKEDKEEKLPDYLGHRQRLKERFLKDKGKAFPDYELLELLLMFVIPRRDVKPMAKALLRRFESLGYTLHARKEELFKIDGIKDNTFLFFQALNELFERITWEKLQEKNAPYLLDEESLIDYCRAAIAFSDVEEFHLIYLNSKKQVIGHELLQRGSISSVSVHPREVSRAALAQNAIYVIMVHNHPSGDVTPSRGDMRVTKRVQESCISVGLSLADHIIISPIGAYSFKAHNLLWEEKVKNEEEIL